MAGHQTPAPMPGRSYYGFLLYIFGWTGIVIYLIWALVPHYYLNQIGITYLPQQYWAIAFPSLLIAGVLCFILLVYPGLNMLLSVPPHDIRTLVDDKTIRMESYSKVDFYIPKYFTHLYNDHLEEKTYIDRISKDNSQYINKSPILLFDTEENLKNPVSVPPVFDLRISDVCHILYRNN